MTPSPSPARPALRQIADFPGELLCRITNDAKHTRNAGTDLLAGVGGVVEPRPSSARPAKSRKAHAT